MMRFPWQSFGLSVLLALCALTSACAQTAPPAADTPVKKTYPAQAAVAAKTVFVTIAASSPGVKKAIDAKNIAGAQKLIGKPSLFQGTVSKVFSPKSNNLVILDFDPDYKSAVTAVAMPDAYAKLPDLKTLEGKHVLISGKFALFHGAPQITLLAPSQVKIIR